MILRMTKLLAEHYSALSVARTCKVDYFIESTPSNPLVRVKVEGDDINKKNFLEELQFRFGKNVWVEEVKE